MTNPQAIDDLRFVRAVVDRARLFAVPSPIYFIWALISVAGFAVSDRSPEAAHLFWSVAGPVGFVVSGAIGWWTAERSGQRYLDLAVRHASHWSATLVGVFLIVLAIPAGRLPAAAADDLILLLLAFSYALAGVHLSRPLLWIGALLAAGYVGHLFVPTVSLLIVGVVLAAGLTAAGVNELRHAANAQQQ